MKKQIAIVTALALLVGLLSGCSSTADDGAYQIAIVQQLDHTSLDEIRTALEDRLDAIAQEQGITISYQTFNGQNDATMLSQIGAQVVADGYDAIIPIATLAAQCMVTAAEGQDIPIIYAAVSDPVEAGLTGFSHVTGTSDALNTGLILDMMLALDPEIQTVGLLYSNSEPNSTVPIREAKAYLEAKGIAYLEKTGNTADEVLSAVNALVGRCDAVFTPTDNVVMNVAFAVSEILTTAGIPYYAGADSFVREGAFATCGVNYTRLGSLTADLAVQILLGGSIGEYQVVDGGIITVNADTATALKRDDQVFDTLADCVVRVHTQS